MIIQKTQLPEPPKLRFKEKFVTVCRTLHLSIHTQRSYLAWAVRFIQYHKSKSEDDLLADPQKKFAAFIGAEAKRGISAGTQSQAFNALVFLYQRVLGIQLGQLPEIERAKRPARLPGVPATHADTMAILEQIHGDIGLALRLTYGTAMRVSETLRLRIRDLDFARGEIRIHGGKGDKDGVVGLPASLAGELKALVKRRILQHEADECGGAGWVHLPHLLAVKYPKAAHATEWQHLFGSRTISVDPVTKNRGRHHLTPEALQQAMRQACAKLKMVVKVSPHGLRHSSAREMERRGSPISEIQKCLRHSDIDTTMRYLGAGTGGKPKVNGPLD